LSHRRISKPSYYNKLFPVCKGGILKKHFCFFHPYFLLEEIAAL